MTSSPDLIHELRASRPSAPADLRAPHPGDRAPSSPPALRGRAGASRVRRGLLVAVPAAAALAFASAGVARARPLRLAAGGPPGRAREVDARGGDAVDGRADQSAGRAQSRVRARPRTTGRSA